MLETNKYYRLNSDNSYFCPTLQCRVKFPDGIVVRPTKCFFYDKSSWFGRIINVGVSIDYETINEIEFTEDAVIEEYQFKDKMPIYYSETIFK